MLTTTMTMMKPGDMRVCKCGAVLVHQQWESNFPSLSVGTNRMYRISFTKFGTRDESGTTLSQAGALAKDKRPERPVSVHCTSKCDSLYRGALFP